MEIMFSILRIRQRRAYGGSYSVHAVRTVFIRIFLLGFLLGCSPVSAFEEYSTAVDPMLQVEPAESEPAPIQSVTAVYGVNADDYLPVKEQARRQLRPKMREKTSRASFDLPDAFYFIGGPVFILIFLRVLVIFLNGFEETRRQEMRMAASDHLPGERLTGE